MEDSTLNNLTCLVRGDRIILVELSIWNTKNMKVTTVTATQMHKRRGEIIRRCSRNGEIFVVEKDGIPVVAIVPFNRIIAKGEALKPFTRH